MRDFAPCQKQRYTGPTCCSLLRSGCLSLNAQALRSRLAEAEGRASTLAARVITLEQVLRGFPLLLRLNTPPADTLKDVMRVRLLGTCAPRTINVQKRTLLADSDAASRQAMRYVMRDA